jgi:glycosyltransferase involved in cell wall biosynthesis
MLERLNFFSSFFQGNGYGGSAEFIALELEKYFSVSLINIRNNFFSYDEKQKREYTSLMEQRLTEEGIKLKRKEFIKGEIGLMYSPPSSFYLLNTLGYNLKVGFTMFETDKLPVPEGLNYYTGLHKSVKDAVSYLDVLLVPSEYNKELFLESIKDIPIEVVPLGINSDLYFDLTKYRQKRRKKTDEFVFLVTGNLTIRKNVGAILTAFLQLFKNRKDVKLIIKTQKQYLGSIKLSNNLDNIKIITDYYTPEQMRRLYASADCFVFATRGEGFGLPPLEAMATGLYTIMPYHTGLKEYAHEKINGLIYTIHKEKAYGFGYGLKDVGYWYTPDFEELKYLMKEAEANREKTYLLGELSAKYAQNFSYKNTAQKIAKIIERYKIK